LAIDPIPAQVQVISVVVVEGGQAGGQTAKTRTASSVAPP
jgi:hypothetical protein